jgi:hypothetical protein
VTRIQVPVSAAAPGAALGRKTWIDLRDFTGYDGTGTTDQTPVLQAAVNQAQAADGRTIYIPNGRHKFTGTVLMQGATSPDGWSGKGGIYLVGESMEGAILQQTVGLPLLQWGSTTSKVAMGLSNLTLWGPGKAVAGSVGLDSRTTGGSYTLDTSTSGTSRSASASTTTPSSTPARSTSATAARAGRSGTSPTRTPSSAAAQTAATLATTSATSTPPRGRPRRPNPTA